MSDRPVSDRGGPAGPQESVRSPDKITTYSRGPTNTRGQRDVMRHGIMSGATFSINRGPSGGGIVPLKKGSNP
jgi:hypothetical protein